MTALLRAISGLILWAIAFSSLYALQALSCAAGWGDVELFAGISTARIALTLLYVGWTACLLWLCTYLRTRSAQPDFLARLAFGCAIIGLVSVVFTGMPVLTATPCS